AATAPGIMEDILDDVDYAWAHFPDRPEPSSPGQGIEPGFVARVGVAARFYDERLRRVESVL
ncbi:MAG TPA: hypothetical protein VMF68_17170, partial [Spirochaetia bacterium]|nr:hypothetical protein [Spirochaetia bacterium]